MVREYSEADALCWGRLERDDASTKNGFGGKERRK
jgi:hypothetical protein